MTACIHSCCHHGPKSSPIRHAGQGPGPRCAVRSPGHRETGVWDAMGKLAFALDSGLLGLPPTPVSISHTGAHGDSVCTKPHTQRDQVSQSPGPHVPSTDEERRSTGGMWATEFRGGTRATLLHPTPDPAAPQAQMWSHKAGGVSHQWACAGPPCSTLQPCSARCAVSTVLPHRGAEGTGPSCISGNSGVKRLGPKSCKVRTGRGISQS